MSKAKVLVTNDDGIGAAGIKAVVEALADTAEVYVFAPAVEQSGKSQSITFLRPVETEKREFEGATEAYAVDGTPADCVKIGITALGNRGIRPDFVISGINLGYNSGLAAYYSGTISAAREGAINSIRSIALSTGAHDANEFEYIQTMLPLLMNMAGSIEPDVLLSVNAPNTRADEIKGYKIVEAAPYGYGLDFLFEELGDGVFQMTGAPLETGSEIIYDIDANEAGYVAVSPIPTSMKDEKSLSELRRFCEDFAKTF